MKLFPFFIFLCSIFIACNSLDEAGFSERIEMAHHKNEFLSHEAVQFDIYLKFGGKERLKAKITLMTNSSSGLLELENGTNIYYSDSKVYYSPEINDVAKVRFDAFTWSYFFLMPYKLNDPGTKWSNYPNKNLGDKTYNVQKLSFEDGVGDAPDDWYVVYSDLESNLLDVVAYIVSYNKSVEEAESDPHAIEYKFYQNVNGVPFAREWAFWEWNAEKGLGEKKLGEATVSNIKFLENLDDKFFTAPSHYLEAK